MKKYFFVLSLLFSTHAVACDGTSTVVNSLVDNGNGTWTAVLTACMEPDDFTGSTSYFYAQFTGANVISASPASITYSDGTVHTLGAVSGSSNNVQWSGATVSTFVAQDCFTFTIVLSAKPSNLSTENGHSSCSQTAIFPTTTNLTCSTSGGVFYDSGGSSSNYGNNLNQVTTICPDTPGGVVTVTFSGIVNTDAVFSTCEDVLSIYDGNSTTSTLIGSWCEVDPSPGSITSTDPSGCLTFQFISDGSTTRSGWSATVNCTYTCAASGSISGSKSICAGESATISVNLSGTAPWSITYNDGSSNTTVNGIMSSPYTFTTTPSSTKTFTLTAVSDANCTGTASGSAVIAVTTPPAPTYTRASTDVTCAGANTGTITITPSSANTTFDWVSGPVTSPIPAGNLPGGATDERSLINLPAGSYCVDITRSSNTTSSTTIFTETWESGSGAWTINNSSGPNLFVVNNTYPGGSCVTGFSTFTIPTVPNQPAGVTAGPTSNYLHIKATTTTGATCGSGSSTPFPPLNANFDSQTSDQKVTMNTALNTVGLTNVRISFVWLAQGETSGTDDYGAIEYSLNGGSTWTQAGAKLRNQPTWLSDSRTDPSWDNQPSLLFRIRWVNDASSSIDPPLGIDEIIVSGDITATCDETVQECFTINSPATVTPTFTALTPVCQGAAAPSLPATSTNGISGTWSPATISTASSGTTVYTFTPTAGQCANTTTLSMTVNPVLTPAITCGTSTVNSVTFNWTALSGATSYAISYTINGGSAVSGGSIATTTYTVNSLSPGDNVVITVTPSGSGCYNAGTGTCSATNCTAPVITAQPPAAVTLCEGSSLTLDVTVTGASAFQWETSTDNGTTYSNLSNGGVYSGVTTASLAISNNTGLNGVIFQLKVTGSNPACPTVTNPSITLSVTPNVTPTFAAIPAVCVGATAPTLPGTSTNGISGTWSPAVSTASAGTTVYTFTPTPGTCATTATTSITVNPVLSPTITCGTTTSTSVNFNWVAVSGASAYTVSYQINGGSSVSGGSITATTYTVSGLAPSDNVSITITPTGTGCFSAGSQTCTASPCTPPVITAQPASRTDCTGSGVSLTVTASGASSYQWQVSTDGGATFTNLSNSGVYSGVTTANLSISDNAGLGGNQYRVIVNEVNNACPVTSTAATLTVTPILGPVVNCSNATTTSVEFSWSAVSGATSYDISYRINGGTTQSGGTTSGTTVTIPGLNAGDVVEITVSVNGTGCYLDANATCAANNCTAPVISTQPQDQSACPGTGTSFSVVETGGNGYQWQVSTDGGMSYSNLTNGGVYSGISTTTLTISDVTGLDGLLYRIIITEVNNACPTTSNPAVLSETTSLAPTVSCSGSTVTDVTFTWVAVGGASGYTIDYQINGGASKSGGTTTSTTYTVTGLSAGDAVDITVTVNGVSCYIPGTASCTASSCTAPVISVQPTDAADCTGLPANFSVTATGASGYQWQVSIDGGATFNNLSDLGVVSGSGTSSLSISDNTGLSGTMYRVVVLETNGICPTTSNAVTLTENAAVALSVNCGSSTLTDITFTWSAATGATDYTISYQVNGGAVQSGGNVAATSYTVSGLTAGDQVDITVTPNGSPCTTVGTTSCTATNCTAPVISVQPVDQISCSGQAATFTVTETGGASYQWQISTDGGASFTDLADGGVYSGATTNTLNVSDNSGLDNNQYRVVIADVSGSCTVTSAAGTISISSAIVISTSNNGPICEGADLTLTSTNVAGASYAWTGPNGYTSASQSPVITGATAANSGDYTVTVTINGCSTTSTTTASVIPTTGLTINPAGPYCPDGILRLLSASAPGGVWSGSGIIDPNTGSFNPSQAAAGANVITYTLAGTCTATATITIMVNPAPIADFGLSATELNPTIPIVSLSNTSSNANSYTWYFGDQMSSTEENPTHKYEAIPGDYTITLIALSADGCRDTARSVITIPEELIFYIPNAFTPNGDKHNNTFQPIFTSGYNPDDYVLQIFDRWGEKVFETHDPKAGWDGSHANDKGEIKTDVYTWKVTFGLSNSAERKTLLGHVNLIL